MIPPLPPLPGFHEAPQRVRPPIVFSEHDLVSGGMRRILGVSPGPDQGHLHLAIAHWTPEGVEGRGRLAIFPGEPSVIVARGIRQARLGVAGLIGRMQGRELAVEVRVLCRPRVYLSFRLVDGHRHIGRGTWLELEEIDALDRGLSWLEAEDGRRADQT